MPMTLNYFRPPSLLTKHVLPCQQSMGPTGPRLSAFEKTPDSTDRPDPPDLPDLILRQAHRVCDVDILGSLRTPELATNPVPHIDL